MVPLYDLPIPEAPVSEISEAELVFHMTQLGYYPKDYAGTIMAEEDAVVDPPQSFTAWALQNRHRPMLVAAIVDEIVTGCRIGGWVGLEPHV